VFYKPNYCCHCGEKIERVDWPLTASRRFCEVCQSGLIARERAPQIFILLMALVGLVGFGSYLRGGEKPLIISGKKVLSNLPAANKNPSGPAPAASAEAKSRALAPEADRAPGNKSAKPVDASAENVAFCGAPTKKGTPCSRRVKGGGRCWQHIREAARQPADKSTAN
jgi:hypothetical protein